MSDFRFQWRRNTAAGAAANNSVLLLGEPGMETDTGKWKLGDGVTAWNSLPYQGGVMSDAALATAVNTGATKAQLSSTFAPVGVPAPSVRLPGVIRPAAAVTVTTFQTGHAFTNNAGGSANLNDTTDFCQGSQAVSAVTDGAAAAKTIKRVAMTAFSAAGRVPRVWVKVDDHTKLAGLQLYLGDTNLANYYKWELKASASVKWLTAGEWHEVTLSWGDATVTGAPNRAVITDAQFRVVDDGTGPVTVRINGIALVPESSVWPNGVVSLTFDDAYATHYTEARKKMNQYGFPGTAYVIQDYIGGASRLTLTQLHALERLSGWEVAGHASTGAVHAARFTSLGQAGCVTEFGTIRAWLRDNGFKGDHVAYPGGEFDATVLDQSERFFTAGRTIFQWGETLPPPRRSKIRCNAYITSGVATATLTALIDRAYTNKEWLVFTFHDLVAVVSASTDYSIANFATVVDYLATKGIPVRTVGEVLATKP